MNILIFSHSSGLRGGAERALLDIIDGLPKNIKPTVCIPSEGELVGALENRGVDIIYSGIHSGWDFESNFSENMSHLYEILELLKPKKPAYDLIISNSSVYPWGGLLAREISIPHLWIVHEIIQMDLSISNRIEESNIQTIGELSEIVLANSKATEKSLVNYIPKSKLKLQYLPIKIKTKNNTQTKGRKITSDTIHILCLGRVAELKRQIDVVKAANLLNIKAKNNIQIHFAGEVNEKYLEEIKKIVNNDLVALVVHGHLEDLSELMNIANIGVISSEVESFGRATYEMLAGGIPVIGTNSGATPELIEHEKNGYLYEVGDIKTLSMYMGRLINDKAEYSRISINAAKISNNFKYDVLISSLVGHLKEASTHKLRKGFNQELMYLFLKNNHYQSLATTEQVKKIEQLTQRLESIYATKTWKTLKKAASVKRRIIK